MDNKVISGLAYNDEVRFFITDATKLCNEISSKLKTAPVCSAAVGRSSMITGIMGLMLKNSETITSIVDGKGPAGKITCVCNSSGELRSTIENTIVDLPLNYKNKLDVSKAVGVDGELHITKDLGLKEPYIGKVNLISGEIAEDYTYYFATSEQIPTAISAGVLVDVDYSIKSAGAFIVQLLPHASDDTINKLEKNFTSLDAISSLLLEKDVNDIIRLVFNDNYKIIDDTKYLSYKCNCSKEKYLEVIQNLNENDKMELKKDEDIECVCNFCNSKYIIKSSLI